MKIISTTILILMFVCAGFGQDNSVKAIVSGKIVEIVPQAQNENADFQIVNILMDGKVIKKFSTGGVTFPQVIGTFSSFDSEYVLYRTFTGNGACAGGDLYVIKFNNNSENNKLKSIETSPVLTSCLGEYPLFGVVYNNKAEPLLTISDNTINLRYLNKWIERKSKAKRRN